MRKDLTQQVVHLPRSWRALLWLLPPRVRLVGLLLLALALETLALGFYASFDAGPGAIVARELAQQADSRLVLVAAATLSFIFLFERPWSWFAKACLRDLRALQRGAETDLDGGPAADDGEGEERSHGVSDLPDR